MSQTELAKPPEASKPEESVAKEATLSFMGRPMLVPKRVNKSVKAVPAPTYEGDFIIEDHLLLQCGRTLVRPTLHYAVYGRLNAGCSNAVLVCHALSGSALVGSWWPELFARDSQIESASKLETSQAGLSEKGIAGARGIVDLEKDCVICINLLGSCYGSTGPGSINPETGKPYGPEFPLISIADNVRAQALLMDSLGIAKWKLAIGGSIGGMQALDWAILYPGRVEQAVVIGVAPLGAMAIALNHLQRQAIQSDPDWLEGRYWPHKQPRKGLALAREIATLSYKSPQLFAERFGRNPNRNGEDPWSLDDHGGGLTGGRFDVAGFLDYQGRGFVERFDANAYLAILRTMETWEPEREFGDARKAFGRIQAQMTFVGISSDQLFPETDVRRLAESVRNAVSSGGKNVRYCEMISDHGHDAFLSEQAELVRLVNGIG
ncbi:homoserine O-acetyltransferase [Acidicapsa dinghuensis]|uniref:Homoserine O-acetyltransferase n=1 Tax=Acidicapsa dinghuensis TaxID=2218256 RepID=A0ABW1EL62_9BACT|nr:homoserine O-acetyltransferase [Acidicapsa dinghuensis]